MPRRKNGARARSGPFRSAKVGTLPFRDTIAVEIEADGSNNNRDFTVSELLPSLSGRRDLVLEKIIVEAIPLFPTSPDNFDCTAQVQFILNGQAVADAPFKMLNSTIATQLGLDIRALGKRVPHILFPVNVVFPTSLIRIQLGEGAPSGQKVRVRVTTMCSVFPQRIV